VIDPCVFGVVFLGRGHDRWRVNAAFGLLGTDLTRAVLARVVLAASGWVASLCRPLICPPTDVLQLLVRIVLAPR
jgi:hypothetical protein